MVDADIEDVTIVDGEVRIEIDHGFHPEADDYVFLTREEFIDIAQNMGILVATEPLR